MKTLVTFSLVTTFAAILVSPAQAQLFGGSLGGSLHNAVGGGFDSSMGTRGGALHGNFGGAHSFDTVDSLNAQPRVARPIKRTAAATGSAAADGRQAVTSSGSKSTGTAAAGSTGSTTNSSADATDSTAASRAPVNMSASHATSDSASVQPPKARASASADASGEVTH